MSRAVADALGGMTLFVESASARSLTAAQLVGILNVMHPDIMIIDDFDRMRNAADLIENIKHIRQRTRVFLATANDLQSMDAAVKRPGRFDEVECVERILSPADRYPDLPAHVAEEVDDWPVAFVEDLHKRLEILGPEALDKEVARMRMRVEQNHVDLDGEVGGVAGMLVTLDYDLQKEAEKHLLEISAKQGLRRKKRKKKSPSYKLFEESEEEDDE
jgi:hypothetical protein